MFKERDKVKLLGTKLNTWRGLNWEDTHFNKGEIVTITRILHDNLLEIGGYVFSPDDVIPIGAQSLKDLLED